jgi:hypothetical protein
MNVYYRTYFLTPTRAANRFCSQGKKIGVHLKIKKRFTECFADYFAHEALGDMPVELFLEKFKYQDNEYERKVFHFLLNDEELRGQKTRPFLTHQLWDGRAELISPVLKYKLQGETDLSFTRALEKKIRVRLDANGLFTRETFNSFLAQVPKEFRGHIEYVEDPLESTEWKDLGVPVAQDFIKGAPFDVLIHKPNARFLLQTDSKVVFSSYMGSDLGLWHAYCELLQKGDLSEYHGLSSTRLYEEEKINVLDQSSVLKLYQSLSAGEWKQLCSI